MLREGRSSSDKAVSPASGMLAPSFASTGCDHWSPSLCRLDPLAYQRFVLRF